MVARPKDPKRSGVGEETSGKGDGAHRIMDQSVARLQKRAQR